MTEQNLKPSSNNTGLQSNTKNNIPHILILNYLIEEI